MSTTDDYAHDFGSPRLIRPVPAEVHEQLPCCTKPGGLCNDARRGGLFIDADGNFYTPAAERAYRLLHGGPPGLSA